MKTLSMMGIILIAGGVLLAIYGYELCAHYFCLAPPYCQNCQVAEPISNLTIYTGIAVMLGGIGFLVYSLRKSTSVKSQ